MKKHFINKLPEPNIVVSSIADLLLTDKDSDDFQKKYLEKEKLDYSVQSLKYVDQYLEKARSNKKSLSNDQYATIILRCGSYSGEVIRKNSHKDFTWVTFDEAVKNHEKIKEFGRSLLTQYVLEDRKTNQVIFPMAKVEKYVSNGKEDSLYFYATVVIDKW